MCDIVLLQTHTHWLALECMQQHPELSLQRSTLCLSISPKISLVKMLNRISGCGQFASFCFQERLDLCNSYKSLHLSWNHLGIMIKIQNVCSYFCIGVVQGMGNIETNAGHAHPSTCCLFQWGLLWSVPQLHLPNYYSIHHYICALCLSVGLNRNMDCLNAVCVNQIKNKDFGCKFLRTGLSHFPVHHAETDVPP